MISSPRSPARGPLIGGLILIAALVGCKRQNSYVPPPPAEVGVAQPLRQKVTPYVTATGNTSAYNQVDLVARVAGYLEQIDYKDGAKVHRGDKLFVIEPPPYQAKLTQAQAALASAEAQARQSAVEYQRQATLGVRDFSSRSTIDQAQATRDTNQANVLNQKAAVEQAQINLGYTTVSAPFDGVVTAHEVDIGALVGGNGPTKLATIMRIDPIYVTFTISEQDVLRIRAGMGDRPISEAQLAKVPVEVGLMTETGYPHKGRLDYAAPTVDSASGTLTVRAVLPNADRALLPGLFVRVRVPLAGQQKEQMLVPDTALGSDQSGRYLLVVDKNDVVQQRTVKTGALVGDLRVIESGLQPEDRVVVAGLQRAVAGSKVVPKTETIKQAMLSQSHRS